MAKFGKSTQSIILIKLEQLFINSYRNNLDSQSNMIQ